jgi:hypothetical protein
MDVRYSTMLLQHTGCVLVRIESFCGIFHIFISIILVPKFLGFEQTLKFCLNRIPKKLDIQIIRCLSPKDFLLFSSNSIKPITKSFHRQQFCQSPLVHALGDALNCSVTSYYID